MFSELNKYKQNGHFFFTRDQKLSEECNAPELPGVYYILQLRKGKVDLVYIGKSGTLNQNGSFSKQQLKTRINNKQNGTKRQDFFQEIMAENDIDALDIYWFVTFDKNHNDLPAFVEATIMQRYFEIYGCLPEWNKSF